MMQRAELTARVRALLQRHTGPDDCIKAVDLLAAAAGEVIVPRRQYDQTRVIRSIVEQLRSAGDPIGFVQGRAGGYFWARSDADLEPTINTFHRRALASLRQERALKRVPFGHVLEQHQLDYDAGSDADTTPETPRD